MTANKTLLQLKYKRVIDTFSKQENIPLRQALDLFYTSETYYLMSNGISDMHCRSDKYLAEELLLNCRLPPNPPAC
jgi:hypothetical protein